MKKQNMLSLSIRSRSRRLPFMAMAILTVAVLAVPTRGYGVFAASCNSTADCQQQISNLNAKNDKAEGSLAQLESQAGSYQAAIVALQAKISDLQRQVDINQAMQTKLTNEIIKKQKELNQQKIALGEDLKAMYVGGQMTTVEMLATSKNLSDFVDASTYSSAVQNKIQDTLATITKLQEGLKSQKAQIDQLLATLSTQRAQAAAARNEQNSLLSYNQSQQVQFDNTIEANKSAISQLYAQQAAIIAASFGGGFHYGGTGGYPYPNAVCLNAGGDCGPYSSSPYNWGVNGYPYDGAGWGYRNCTSYAFWRLAQTTGVTLYANSFTSELKSPNGGIKYSIRDFQRMGYTVDDNPNGQAVLAVQTQGTYGHIMYVEGVVNGDAVVSQYNAQEDGRYSTGTLTNIAGIDFVHIK